MYIISVLGRMTLIVTLLSHHLLARTGIEDKEACTLPRCNPVMKILEYLVSTQHHRDSEAWR